jgi:hypothetical protein
MGEVDIDTALAWRGRTVVDRSDEKIGTLTDIYLDADERPHWGAVRTGLFGTRETLVPLDDARQDGDLLRVPFEHDRVKDAPNLEPDAQLSNDEEEELYRHYGVGSRSPDAAGSHAAGDAAPDEPQQQESEAGDAMTRSEEEVHISKRPRARGRARLKKYVVTDYVEKKVPVQREEVRLEYEPHDQTSGGE